MEGVLSYDNSFNLPNGLRVPSWQPGESDRHPCSISTAYASFWGTTAVLSVDVWPVDHRVPVVVRRETERDTHEE